MCTYKGQATLPAIIPRKSLIAREDRRMPLRPSVCSHYSSGALPCCRAWSANRVEQSSCVHAARWCDNGLEFGARTRGWRLLLCCRMRLLYCPQLGEFPRLSVCTVPGHKTPDTKVLVEHGDMKNTGHISTKRQGPLVHQAGRRTSTTRQRVVFTRCTGISATCSLG